MFKWSRRCRRILVFLQFHVQYPCSDIRFSRLRFCRRAAAALGSARWLRAGCVADQRWFSVPPHPAAVEKSQGGRGAGGGRRAGAAWRGLERRRERVRGRRGPRRFAASSLRERNPLAPRGRCRRQDATGLLHR